MRVWIKREILFFLSEALMRWRTLKPKPVFRLTKNPGVGLAGAKVESRGERNKCRRPSEASYAGSPLDSTAVPRLALVAMGRESGEDGKADRVMSELVLGEIKVLRVNELRWDGFLQRIGRTAAASTCYSHMNGIEQCIILYS
jgi:hypothetical protein